MAALYTNHYINIDSSNRQKKDTIIFSDTIFTENVSIISNCIIIKDNRLREKQQIKITGIISPKKVIRSIIKNVASFEIFHGTNVMKILYPHGLPLDKHYGYTIEIKNFSSQDNFIGNISTNFINKTHILYTTLPGYAQDINWFYIKLGKELDQSYTIREHNFEILFNYISVIPLSAFSDVLTINKVDKGTAKIILPYYDQNTLEHNIGKIGIKIIKKIIPGFIDPCCYTIDLQSIYYNVVMLKLVSVNFPNMSEIIFIGDNNNYISWDDGVKYCVKIKSGAYSLTTLVEKINKKIFKSDLKLSVNLNISEVRIEASKFISNVIMPMFNIFNVDGYKFKGYVEKNDYALMKIDNFNLIRNNGEEYFAKVYGNNFSYNDKFLVTPICYIKEISISFYDKFNNLLKFYGLEHSFVLECVTVNEIAEHTNYYNRSLSNYNKTNFNTIFPFT